MKRVAEIYRNFMAENRPWLKRVAVWFILATGLGVVVFYYDQSLLEDILKIFEDKFGPDPALDFRLAMQIFWQNFVVAVLALFGGVFLGIVPLAVILANGFILGYILSSVFRLSDAGWLNNLLFAVFGLLPHGILEIPAIILAVALGARLGTEWLGKNSAGQRWEVFKQAWKSALLGLPLVIIFLFLAAMIEVFVSGKLIGG